MISITRISFGIAIVLGMALTLTGSSRARMALNAPAGVTSRVSTATNGQQADGGSEAPSVSWDGRYVAFNSDATNLVGNDTNNVTDTFVKDTSSGIVTRVSVATNGTQANRESADINTSITFDGHYVAFTSTASNLVSGDTNTCTPYYTEPGECPDIFVHSVQTGATQRVSVASGGTQANGASYHAAISASGVYVAFTSEATNLVPDDANAEADIFVYNRLEAETTRVSVSSSGEQGNDASSHPFISGNGRYIVFTSYASNLTSNDTNNDYDVFLHDMQTGETTCISLDPDGGSGNGGSSSASMSNDTRYIVFSSVANNLVVNDENDAWDVFLYDRETGQTSLVSVAQDGSQGNDDADIGSISANGRHVSFYSRASNLVSGDTNMVADIFVRDLLTHQTTRLSVANDGTQGDVTTYYDQSKLSANGQFGIFESPATTLVVFDTNNAQDIFAHYRDTSILSPTLTSNYSTGMPGSFFTFTGIEFPLDTLVNITINGYAIGDIQSNSLGEFTFLLNTQNAVEGIYTVTATAPASQNLAAQTALADLSASTTIALDYSEPLREQEGRWTIFMMPEAYLLDPLYLPLIKK